MLLSEVMIKSLIYIVILIICWTVCVMKRKNYVMFAFTVSIMIFLVTNVFIWIESDFTGMGVPWDFTDFTDPVKTGYGNIISTNYPPIATIVFKFFHLLVVNKTSNTLALWYGTFLFLFICLAVIIILSLDYIRVRDANSEKNVRSILAVLLLSSPLLYALSRANLILIAYIGILLFLLYYDSESVGKRSIAIIGLVIAANIKYYPAAFGLLLLKKKRYKEAIISAFLGLLVFFIPIWYEVGISGTFEGIRSLFAGSQEFVDYYRDNCAGLSTWQILNFTLNILGISFSKSLVVLLNRVILAVVIGTSLACSYFTVRDDTILFMCGALCMFVPTVNFWYSAISLLPAMVVALCDRKQTDFFSGSIIALFSLSVVYYETNKVPLGNGFAWSIYLLWLVYVIECLKDRFVLGINRRNR